MPHTVPSIQELGLENYLNKNYAAEGGYTELEKRMKLKEPAAVIARALKVNIKTMNKWIAIYKENNDVN